MALMYTHIPGIATSSNPTGTRINPSQVGVRLFAMFPPVNTAPQASTSLANMRGWSNVNFTI